MKPKKIIIEWDENGMRLVHENASQFDAIAMLKVSLIEAELTIEEGFAVSRKARKSKKSSTNQIED